MNRAVSGSAVRSMVKLAGILLVASVTFGAAEAAVPDPIHCAASIAPVAFLVKDVGGANVSVVTLLPPGASPHGHEVGPETVRSVARAEIAFFIGRHLDEWAEGVVRGVHEEATLVRLGDGLPGPEPEGDAEHGGIDPHVWLDPVKMAAMAERVRDALIARRPDLSDPIRSSAAATMRAYAALDSLCRVRLDPVRSVPFVAYHGGMNHLVARYGLSQVAVLEPFPGREPSPRYMKEVVLTVRRTGARVVFSEPQISARLAEVVGRESGIPVVEIDVLGGLPGRTTYDGLMRSMLDTLTGALARGAAR